MHSGKRTRMANGIYPTPNLLFPGYYYYYYYFLYLVLRYRFRDNIPRIRLAVLRNDLWVASLQSTLAIDDGGGEN
jgi:hypothetical protein